MKIIKKNILFLLLAFLLTSCFKEDNSEPLITLKGDLVMKVVLGKPFLDPGFIATDNKDGDISYLVKVNGQPDEENAGVYFIRYNVTDASGNPALEQTRVVYIILDNTVLDVIYEAEGYCSNSFINNNNNFVSFEKDNDNSNLLNLKFFNQTDFIVKAAITGNTGQILNIPEQTINDTNWYGSGEINTKGTEISLAYFKKKGNYSDSCFTFLKRNSN